MYAVEGDRVPIEAMAGDMSIYPVKKWAAALLQRQLRVEEVTV
jgi:hypothetical protein